jgi:hypothetical protein
MQNPTQELKSARQIIALLQEDMNTLKREFMQDDMSGKNGPTIKKVILIREQ